MNSNKCVFKIKTKNIYSKIRDKKEKNVHFMRRSEKEAKNEENFFKHLHPSPHFVALCL